MWICFLETSWFSTTGLDHNFPFLLRKQHRDGPPQQAPICLTVPNTACSLAPILCLAARDHLICPVCAPHVLLCHLCALSPLLWFTFRFSHLCQKSYLLLIPDRHLLLGNNLFCFVIHTVFYLQLINFCLIVLLFLYSGYLLYLLNLSSKTLNFLTLGPRLKCLFFFPFSPLSLFSFISMSFILSFLSFWLYDFVQPSAASPRCYVPHKKTNFSTPNPRSSKIWIHLFLLRLFSSYSKQASLFTNPRVNYIHFAQDKTPDEGCKSEMVKLVKWTGLIVIPSEFGRQEEKGETEDQMAGWYHWLNAHELEHTPGDSEGKDRGAWCAALHRIAKSWTWLSNSTTKTTILELSLAF